LRKTLVVHRGKPNAEIYSPTLVEESWILSRVQSDVLGSFTAGEVEEECASLN
jgi:hypothetical protein